MSDDDSVDAALAAIERAGGLITREEIAKEWRVPLATIVRRIERGDFPPPLRRVSGTEVYLRAQVEPLRFARGMLRGVSARHPQIDADPPR